MFCRQYDAATAEQWGLVNAVVPLAELRSTVRAWADEALALSPTALKVLKHSFNAETEHIAGIGAMAFDSLELFVGTPEAAEGVTAFNEKRPPDFSPHR
jgi:naphthoate synthase